jgi:hypothetical protein
MTSMPGAPVDNDDDLRELLSFLTMDERSEIDRLLPTDSNVGKICVVWDVADPMPTYADDRYYVDPAYVPPDGARAPILTIRQSMLCQLSGGYNGQ